MKAGTCKQLQPARFVSCLLAVLLANTVASCASCRDAEFVAELIDKRATVERDFERAPETWSAANSGDRFVLGDAVRTGTSAQATLALPRRARLLVKSDTVVRFKRSVDGSQPHDQIEMQQGEVTVETGVLDLGVSTVRGVVRLSQGSRVRMRAEPQNTHFDVIVGRVEYTRDGAARSAAAGTGFDVEVLKVSVETPTPPGSPQAPPPQAASASEQTARPRPAEPDDTYQDSPPSAIVRLIAGETATIHDPAPPSEVGVTGTCPELAVLELDRGNGRFDAIRVRGSGEVRARVPRGSFSYRLRCVRDGRLASAGANGRLTIAQDAATRPIPLAPASISADADGRRYTVSYQNRLPVITLRWPDAPASQGYRLFVQPSRGPLLSAASSQASVTLEPGRVQEGLHQFWFETTDKKLSKTGQLQVSFDYTARTAYLTSPVDGEQTQAGRTRFAGGALLGSSVQVQGATLSLDPQGRFATSIDVPADAGGSYVRVQHRSAGIHYYIRHLR